MNSSIQAGYMAKQAYIVPASLVLAASQVAAEGTGTLDRDPLKSREIRDRLKSQNPWNRLYLKGRLARASAEDSQEANGPRNKSHINLATEMAGPATSGMLTGGIGAGLGAGVANRYGVDPVLGGVLGGGLGFAAPVLAAYLVVQSKRPRTSEEQIEHDRHSAVLDNLLIPGMASYQAMQRERTARNRYGA